MNDCLPAIVPLAPIFDLTTNGSLFKRKPAIRRVGATPWPEMRQKMATLTPREDGILALVHLVDPPEALRHLSSLLCARGNAVIGLTKGSHIKRKCHISFRSF